MNEKFYRLKNTWNHIKSRCLNPRSIDWKYYGGRGIKICDRWSDEEKIRIKGKRGRPHTIGFLNFYDDMESTWFLDATIDRVDNDGDYCPENCRWITRSENTKNRNELHGNPTNSNEVKRKISQTLRSKGEDHSSKRLEFRQERSNAWSGDGNPSKRLEIRESRKGDRNVMRRPEVAMKHRKPKPKVICEFCGISCSMGNYKRWHGINCKVNRIIKP